MKTKMGAQRNAKNYKKMKCNDEVRICSMKNRREEEQEKGKQ